MYIFDVDDRIILKSNRFKRNLNSILKQQRFDELRADRIDIGDGISTRSTSWYYYNTVSYRQKQSACNKLNENDSFLMELVETSFTRRLFSASLQQRHFNARRRDIVIFLKRNYSKDKLRILRERTTDGAPCATLQHVQETTPIF